MSAPQNRGAREGLAERTGTSLEVAGKAHPPTLVELIGRQERQVERALPSHLKANAAAYTRALVTVVKQTPQLMQCDPGTVLGGLMLASQLGLEFGPLGKAYLLPFRNNRTGRTEAQFVLGYKGVIDLAWRSGKLASVIARTVRAGDHFDFEYGLADKLEHKPELDGDGAPFAWYAVSKFKDGGHAFVVLGRADVERHRKRSKAKDKGPWVTDYDAMARKSAILELKPFLPLTTEVERELAFDGAVAEGDDAEDLEVNYIDADAVDDADADNLPLREPMGQES